MHRQIIAHAVAIDHTNLHLLDGVTFAFICIHGGEVKRTVVEKLEALGASFIDVGMGLELEDGSLGGIVRVTASTPNKRDHAHQRLSFVDGGEDDVYSTNIQVADLNALNAVMAVIKWRKIRGFYRDLEREHHSTYTTDGNMLLVVTLDNDMFDSNISLFTTFQSNWSAIVLYISMDYATAAHSCCCGCGEQVVTPFTPHDWQMTFDGETISIWPSIGNWDYACHSHYVVRRSRVIEADPWSDEEIGAGRVKDREAKKRFYSMAADQVPAAMPQPADKLQRVLSRIKSWVVSRKP